MTSFVEVLSCQDNAAWDGHEMLACQGRPYIAELDVTAHEWGHALTEKAPGARRSDLAYEKESGALNEAFSDWLGTAIEQSHFPGSANWTLGETIEAFRDMADPPRFQQPDTYRQGAWWIDTLACTPTEGNDECGVHTNSGVPNKAFYLLAHGGTFGGVAVPGVGIGTAIRIAFDANVHYWPASATFMDARDGMIAAAQPYGMPAVQSVRNAWAAVGVGALAPVPGDVAPRAAPNASVDIADVVQELRYSVGLDTASAQELARGDIAPSDVIDPASNPVVVRPRPDGQVNISDVVLLLRASVGLSTFG